MDRKVRQLQSGGQAARRALRAFAGRSRDGGAPARHLRAAALVARAHRSRALRARAAHPAGAKRGAPRQADGIAHLASDRLGDAREAIALWNRLLELDETDGEALAALGALYEREKRWLASSRCCGAKARSAPATRAGSRRRWCCSSGSARSTRRSCKRRSRRLAPIRRSSASCRLTPRRSARCASSMRGRALRRSRAAVRRERAMGRAVERYSTGSPRACVGPGRERSGSTRRSAPRRRRASRSARAGAEGLGADPRGRSDAPAAAQALVPIYREAEKWARLIATYEICSATPTCDVARLALNQQIRALSRREARLAGLAFSWCAKALTIRPTNGAVRWRAHGWRRRPRPGRSWSSLRRGRRQRGGSACCAERTGARAHPASGCTDPDEARKHFVEILAPQPDDEEALATLERSSTRPKPGRSCSSSIASGSARRRRRAGATGSSRSPSIRRRSSRSQGVQATYRQVLDADRPAADRPRARALEECSRAARLGRARRGARRRLASGADADAEDRAVPRAQLGELVSRPARPRHNALAHQPRRVPDRAVAPPALTALEAGFCRQPGDTKAAADRVPRRGCSCRLRGGKERRKSSSASRSCSPPAAKRRPRQRSASLLRRLGRSVGRELGDPSAPTSWPAGCSRSIRPT